MVNRVAVQLQKALSEKGLAMLVNHGISEEKVTKMYIPEVYYFYTDKRNFHHIAKKNK